MMSNFQFPTFCTKHILRITWVLILLIQVNGISFEEDTTLTKQQRVALDKFKELMSPRLPHEYMKEDIYLVKWLRASNWDVKEADKFLMNNLEWRWEQKMDTIHEEDWSDVETEYNFKYYLDGRDKLGRSFLYVDIAPVDIRRAIIQGKHERFLRYADKMLDDACNLVEELGEKYHNITRGHLIINLNGFNLIQHGCIQCIPLIFRFVVSYGNHYPGCADQIILLNAPNILAPVLDAIRPAMNSEIRQGLKVFGKNSNTWKEALSKDFDFNKLPRSIGGTAVYKGMEEY